MGQVAQVLPSIPTTHLGWEQSKNVTYCMCFPNILPNQSPGFESNSPK